MLPITQLRGNQISITEGNFGPLLSCLPPPPPQRRPLPPPIHLPCRDTFKILFFATPNTTTRLFTLVYTRPQNSHIHSHASSRISIASQTAPSLTKSPRHHYIHTTLPLLVKQPRLLLLLFIIIIILIISRRQITVITNHPRGRGPTRSRRRHQNHARCRQRGRLNRQA